MLRVCLAIVKEPTIIWKQRYIPIITFCYTNGKNIVKFYNKKQTVVWKKELKFSFLWKNTKINSGLFNYQLQYIALQCMHVCITCMQYIPSIALHYIAYYMLCMLMQYKYHQCTCTYNVLHQRRIKLQKTDLKRFKRIILTCQLVIRCVQTSL